MKKTFLCIHGFGNLPERGRKNGFSHGLRDGVKTLLGDYIVWEEVAQWLSGRPVASLPED